MHESSASVTIVEVRFLGFDMIVSFQLFKKCVFSFVVIDNFSSNAILTVNMQVYVDLFSVAILLLGGALACYGEHLLFCVVVFFTAFSNFASHVLLVLSM